MMPPRLCTLFDDFVSNYIFLVLFSCFVFQKIQTLNRRTVQNRELENALKRHSLIPAATKETDSCPEQQLGHSNPIPQLQQQGAQQGSPFDNPPENQFSNPQPFVPHDNHQFSQPYPQVLQANSQLPHPQLQENLFSSSLPVHHYNHTAQPIHQTNGYSDPYQHSDPYQQNHLLKSQLAVKTAEVDVLKSTEIDKLSERQNLVECFRQMLREERKEIIQKVEYVVLKKVNEKLEKFRSELNIGGGGQQCKFTETCRNDVQARVNALSQNIIPIIIDE